LSYGAQAKVGIAKQAAANSWQVNAGSYFGLGFLTEDIGLEKQELISQNLSGRFEQGAVYSGISNVHGTLQMELTPRSLLAACGMVLANSATTVDSGSMRNWTFVPNTQDFSSTFVKPPISIYKQWSDANSAELFYDCQAGQLDLAFGQGQFLKGTVTIAGGTRLPTGIGSMAVTPLASDVGRLFPWNVTSISYGGVGLSQFSDFTISMNENVGALYTVNGTLAPFKFTRTGFREVTVNGTFYMNDRSMLNNFVAETQQQLLITSINTKAAIQSGYYDTFVIDIPQLKITACKPGNSGPGEVSVKFTGRGVLDPTSNYAFQILLQNTYQATF